VTSRKFSRFTQAGDVLKGLTKRIGMDSERMVILNEVWEREAGHFSRHWTLSGVKSGILYVRVSSPAAAQELHLRAGQLVKSLNKYFKKSWIKEIRAKQR
jgi:hypothetical protein